MLKISSIYLLKYYLYSFIVVYLLYAGIIFLCQAIVPSFSNIISNGDFESESGLDPWYCNQAHCDVITDASQHFLALTQRKAVWSGPRQLLDPDLFNSIEDLKTTFNFSMYSESSDSIHAEWKIKVEKGQETQYFSLFGSIGKSFILRCHSQMTHLLFEIFYPSLPLVTQGHFSMTP